MKKSLLVLGGAALLGFTAITPPASAQTLPSNDGRSSSPSLDNPGITATITDPIYRTPYPRNTPPGRLVAVEKADWKLIYPFVAEYPSFVWWQDTYKIAFHHRRFPRKTCDRHGTPHPAVPCQGSEIPGCRKQDLGQRTIHQRTLAALYTQPNI